MDNSKYEAKMQKTLDVLQDTLGGIRAGRANAGVLHKIKVDYYGAPTPLNQVAAYLLPRPQEPDDPALG